MSVASSPLFDDFEFFSVLAIQTLGNVCVLPLASIPPPEPVPLGASGCWREPKCRLNVEFGGTRHGWLCQDGCYWHCGASDRW